MAKQQFGSFVTSRASDGFHSARSSVCLSVCVCVCVCVRARVYVWGGGFSQRASNWGWEGDKNIARENLKK
jgi:hypothetical protein